MAQLSSDSVLDGQALLPLHEAVRLLFERIPAVVGTEDVPLAEAIGRILAEPVVAGIDLPGFDNSAVDGFAVRFRDLVEGGTVLRVAGRIAAGQAAGGGTYDGAAVRIFTGAPLPAGFDTVFMQEDCRLDDSGAVVLPVGLAKGSNTRPKGEDVTRGAVALDRGRRLAPEDMALAAALGASGLTVRRALRVAIFSTGDEIVSPGEPLHAASVYDANRFLLIGLLRRVGASVTDLGVLPDTERAIRCALEAAAPTHDLLLTSGGVSVGEEDHVKAAVSGSGSLAFWRVAIKPGRPVALGAVGGAHFVGLPGNPVAVFVTFVAVVRPLLAALAGETWAPPVPLPVPSAFSYRKKRGRREYVRAMLGRDAAGQLVAQKHPVEGAGVLTSLTQTDGLVELGEDVVAVEPGDSVGFLGYAALR